MGREDLRRVALPTRTLIFLHIFSQKENVGSCATFRSKDEFAGTVSYTISLVASLFLWPFGTQGDFKQPHPLPTDALYSANGYSFPSLTDAHWVLAQGGHGILSQVTLKLVGQGAVDCFGTNSGIIQPIQGGSFIIQRNQDHMQGGLAPGKGGGTCSSQEQMRKLVSQVLSIAC